MSIRGGLLVWVGGVTWLFLAGAGFLVLLNHAFEPARVGGPAPIKWPRSSALPGPGALPRLVMFVHPHCPCTLASLQELRAIAQQRQPHLEVQVVVLHSDELAEGWSEAETVRQVSHVPGASIFRDDHGAEAARFGAAASRSPDALCS